jgi:hypothetical protein
MAILSRRLTYCIIIIGRIMPKNDLGVARRDAGRRGDDGQEIHHHSS